MKRYLNFVKGDFVAPCKGEFMSVTDPSTEEVISEVPRSCEADVVKAVDAASCARLEWSRMPSVERASHLRQLVALLKANQDRFAKADTQEQGKILSLSYGNLNFAITFIEYAAEWARRLEGEIVPSDSRGENILICQQPRGIVVGLTPWNFSIGIIGRKLGPALIAGNTIVIKPSSLTPNNAFDFAELVKDSGIPKGVINIISGEGSTIGKILTTHPKVDMVSLTGSVESGQEVMRNAALNLTRVSLELGGKAPAIVMDDADLELAVKDVVQSRLFGIAGQICNAAERVYVQEGIAQEFIGRLVEEIRKLRVGDPLRADVDMGPLVSKTALEKVSRMVSHAVEQGAMLAAGGRRPKDLEKGFFYEPTVLTKCRQDMEIMQEEIFGPVLPIMTFASLEEAISLANDCQYGLASSIHTRSMRNALKAVNELEFGETYVNRAHMEAVQGFHAGWKKSGMGGEDGKHGVMEYLQSHVAYIKYDM